ncbi:MAG TPA: PTS sugar transporter subunit IIB [Pseudogracilibacillus sp.]|nr:PTS sugar transporter subunit IIB [Pseudogracilibacillus sp.]
MTKKIVIACGAGLATSTMIAEKVKVILEEAGIDYSLTQSQIYEMDSYDDSADLFITSMKVEKDRYQTPIVTGTPFIMGINEEATKEQILKELSN